MSNLEIHGRFLPSRVYHRWKWAVRLGLLVVPFLLLLSGSITLFLTPSKYESLTLFSMEKGPSGDEIVELLTARDTLRRVSSNLELPNRFNVDSETAQSIIKGTTTVRLIPETQLVEVSTLQMKNTDARDVAEQLPLALKAHLLELSEAEIQSKSRSFQTLIDEAADRAAEKSAEHAKLEQFHGAKPADPAAAATVERSQRMSQLADAEMERLQNEKSEFLTQMIKAQPQLHIHTAPQISSSPHSPNVAKEFSRITLYSLGSGLLVALLLPYLLEFALPRGSRREPEIIAVFDT